MSVFDLIRPFNIQINVGEDGAEISRSARYQPRPEVNLQETRKAESGRDVAFEVMVEGQPATVMVDTGVAQADYRQRMDALQKLLRCVQ